MSTPPRNGGYQPDPYQQQYDAYTAPHQPQPGPGGWPPQQQGQPQYGAAPGWQQPGQPPYAAGPQGPGWGHEPPKNNNKLPIIVGAALLVIGAVVATIIIVTNKSDSSSSAASTSTSEQASAPDSGGSSEPTGSEPTDSGSEPSGGSGGSSNGTLPADFPVPPSVQVDDSGTYCSGKTCFGSFKTDDPAAAYDDWVAALEDAGYSISSKNIAGKGKDTIWTIEAEGPLSIAIYYASQGAFTSS
ncbi:hypothetical protein [Cumulibacter manganitolerans]|uniref:hypothetical protein n=1 Tax=Cumulibacter manganitolerans TaxID=1884992 RepID=UPI0012960C92|nr:hypothetical protein [Cumulibacter manganitolerans]